MLMVWSLHGAAVVECVMLWGTGLCCDLRLLGRLRLFWIQRG